MPKRILMVNEFFSHGDGSSFYLIKISEALAAQGYTVGVLYGTKRPRECRLSGVKTWFVPGMFGFNYINTPEGFQGIRNAVQESRPDIIYLHQVLNPRVVSMLADAAPAIRYEHGFRLSCPTGRRMPRAVDRICDYPFSFKCLLRAHTQKCMPRNPFLAVKRVRDVYANIAAHRKLRKILVASAYIKDLLVRSGLDGGCVSIVPYFSDAPFTGLSQGRGKRPCLLFAGRLEYEKGAHLLLQALSSIQTPCDVIIAGEGTELGNLKAMASGISGHTVAFPGWVDNEKLAEYYRTADVVVVASFWPEPFGIIGIEAMSQGKPVVAFDVGGISEWLSHAKTGFLVERGDVPAMAGRITQLLDDPQLCGRMGEAARASFLSRFTKEAHLNELERIFKEALVQPI